MYSSEGLPRLSLRMRAMPLERGFTQRRMALFHSSMLAQAVASGRWA
jgi:hypothetical protein